MHRNEESKNGTAVHVISLEDRIGTAIRTALTEIEQDPQARFNDDLLVEVSRSVVYHVGFEGDIAFAYEDVITENISAFSGQPVEERILLLLTQIIKVVVEPFISQQNDYYDFTIEEDDGDGSENVDQIASSGAAAGAQDTGMRARKRQIDLTDSITTASHHNDSTVASEAEDGSEMESDEEAEDQDRVNEWMEQVMAKSEQEYLQEESDYSDVAPDEPVSERAHIYQSPARAEKEESSSEQSSDSEEENDTAKVHASADKSVDRPLYHLTSSDDDTLHSERSIERKKAKQAKEHEFQSPAPYQIRKSAAAIYDAAEAEEKEPLPAWLMPKSPLDAHFRKAYGGLGKDDLQETIELITSTQKKALRASRIADDNEESSTASSDQDAQNGHLESEDESHHTDAGAIDEPLPAWLMPKSPLDAHFRKGYGGLGKEDLQDAIEEITTAQKKAQAHIRASQRVPDEFDLVNAITVDDLPDNFGIVGTPTHVRPARRLSGSEGNSGGSGGSKAKGREYAKQQKLFQSPKPSRIPVAVSSAKKSAAKVAPSEESLPAWLMPKSPLDAHFRKGYGGLGHEDLDEAIAEITSSQKKAQRAAAGPGRDADARRSISKMLENYYDSQHNNKATSGGSAKKSTTPSKGKKKGSKKHGTDTTTTGETSDAIMFDTESGVEEEKYSQIDLPAEQDADHLLPSAHPSTSPPGKLTNNASLNAMMRQSFQSYVSQYAKSAVAPESRQSKVESKSGQNSRSSTPQSTKKKFASSASPTSAAIGSGTKTKAPLSSEEFSAYLRSPELKHNFDEIDALIRESQKNLRRMKLEEQKAFANSGNKRIQKTRSSSIVSNVSLTDHESQEPRPRGKKIPRAKLTKRVDAPSSKPLERRDRTDSASAAAAKLAAKANAKAQRLSTAKLHEQSTGNVRQTAAAPSGLASVSTAPVSWSRRSSTTTMASKISQTLLNEGPARLPSPSPRLARSPSPALHAQQQRVRSQTKPRARSAPVVQPAQRLLRVDSRLLVPTTAALIRSADIATNSSKAANLHNEWHNMLRSGDADMELSGRKLRNKILRRSLPAVSAEQIIEWNSPDKKSKSVDFLYGLRNNNHEASGAIDADLYLASLHPANAGTGSAVAGGAPQTPKRRASGAHNIVPLAATSRLIVPTVTSVMRSLLTAQQSPVIRRLEKTVHNKPSKTYLLHGEKLAQRLQAAEKPTKKRKMKKRKTARV